MLMSDLAIAPSMAPSLDPSLESAAAPLLQARGLSVSPRGVLHGAEVLRAIDFTLYPGRTLGLVGESGAGKSMLGRVIARQLPDNFAVSGGSLLFQGRDLLAMPAAEHRALLGPRIAFIPQEPMTALNPVRTIGDQFIEHLRRLGVPRAACRDRALAALDEVRLPASRGVMDKYAFQLSGGMCQRVMIAMAFAGDPALVVSDEATTALDASTQAHVVTLIRAMQARRGTSVIFVTHDLALAAHVCDELAVLYAGEVVESGPAAQVTADARHPYTRALQRANPQLAGPRRLLQPLLGHMPGIGEFGGLAGCRFQPRCEVALAVCDGQVPALAAAGMEGQHQLRCWHGPCPPQMSLAGDAALLDDAHLDTTPLQSTGPFLQVQGIGKVYPGRGWGGRGGVAAVRDISFDIAPGEFVGIIGESGSGKSSLGRLVMGLETPSSGRILLNGQPLGGGDREWARRIASVQMIFQDPRAALNPRRRVRSLLTQMMESRPTLASVRQRRASELLAAIGLAPDLLERFPSQMSGGQRQRINIGRALCDVPQLLVADEIVSGLDVSVQAQILNLLLRLRAEHKVSLLLISHDLAVVRYLCSRVMVMHGGAVVESGPTEQVLSAPSHPYTRSLLAMVPPADTSIPWPPAA
ncbi:peptide/nickel transport system ATP-binding protein [Pseudoduganella lurida]|uniref:Peptide/nickel transport system ATP-binding protein n=1 Tax=Pseudoduganella lurida TaxID=1036180 RepID=A0A562RC14_9BURK|nr:ABC transporter ATP-binding protein [Pseudoduganella lurida]TWI66578.1 peptide/nickel transport system ATP-binding protein [Pseudoduganella lurida]